MSTLSTTKVFHLDYVSEDDDSRYQGAFTVKRLSIRDKSAVAVRNVQLNGGMHSEGNGRGVDLSTDNWNFMIATLEVSLVAAPKWWNLDEIYDMGLVQAVYAEVRDFHNTFLTKRNKVQQSSGISTASQEGSGAETSSSNGSRESSTLVGDEVRYELDP